MKFNFECDDSFDSFCKHNDIDYSIAYNELGYYPRDYMFKKTMVDIMLFWMESIVLNNYKKTFIHEIKHILENHLDKHKSLKVVYELEAQSIALELNCKII